MGKGKRSMSVYRISGIFFFHLMHRRAERSYSMFKIRRGSREMIPLVQGKEQ